MQKLQRHGLTRLLRPPETILFGLKPGASAPVNWSVYGTADDYLLKGTDSDAIVGTIGSRSSISGGSTYDGSHSSGASYRWTKRYGWGAGITGPPTGTPSVDGSAVGGHNHSLSVSYRPRICGLKLVQAGVGALFHAGLIGFAASDLAKHTAYSLFDGDAGYLGARSATALVAHSLSAYCESADNSHSHVKDGFTTINWTDASNVIIGGGNAGGSHTHSYNPTITPALACATVRAFEILDKADITGLIGMWPSIGVPLGWEIVAELTDRYIKFSASGDGSQSGSNIVSISGNTGNDPGHSHPYGLGIYETVAVAAVYHPDTIYHYHGGLGSVAYQPERFHVKFIRYVG